MSRWMQALVTIVALELFVIVVGAVTFAQPQVQPLLASTVQTTDTTTSSLLIGCAIGSTTCSGGARVGSLIFTSPIGTSGNKCSYDGSNLILCGLPGTTSAKKIVFTDSTGASVATIDATGALVLNGTANTGALTATSGTINGSLTTTGVFNATGTGSHLIGGGGTGAASTLQINGSTAAGSGAYVSFANNGSVADYVGLERGIISGTSNNLVLYAATTAGHKFYVNAGTLAWGINSAGDSTFGASSHIADSSGTPTIGSGFGTSPTITGADYAFAVTVGSTSGATGTVNFAHTFNAAPVCVAISTADPLLMGTVGTTSAQINYGPGVGNFTNGSRIAVLCRGY